MLPNEGPRLRMGGMDAYEKPKTPTQLISYSNHKLFNVQNTPNSSMHCNYYFFFFI